MIQPVTIDNYSEILYALILPDGSLYDAERFGGHCSLAYKLHEAELLPSHYYDNCVHVSSANFDFITERYGKEYLKVTQKQIDTMLDYTLAHNKPFDFSQMEIIDAKPTVKPSTRPLLFASQSSAVR